MTASTSATERRFVPAIVVGWPGGDAAVARDYLQPLAGQETPLVTPEDLGRDARRLADTGLLVLVPGPDRAFLDGLEDRLRELRGTAPGLPVILVGDRLGAPEVAASLRAGVDDVVFLGWGGEAIRERVAPLLERRRSMAAGLLFPPGPGVPGMIGVSPRMRQVADLVRRVASSDATVLVLGESGTGKELIARALHAFSPRRRKPFVAINCAAIPETLLENELFGHEKGAYTGANARAIGKVEAAEGGTLFLDEIGEMPLPLQAKILRLLQDHTYDRIGGTRTRKADIRVVTATNRDLREEVAAKRFREDLYYRLSVVPVELPALRERPEDIPALAGAILERLARRLERPGLHLSPEAMERLVRYRWPGNVRELENELERAAVLCGSDEIGPEALSLRSRIVDPDRAALARLAPLDASLAETVRRAAEAAGRIRVSVALEEAEGDLDRAAAALGISREELESRL